MSDKSIFVFGSNLAGRHGAGAAFFAVANKGAIYGQGVGLQGQSYAIPTKDHNMRTLPLDTVKYYIDAFVDFAAHNPELKFQLTQIGCGLAGYTPEDIIPLLPKLLPCNVFVPPEWFLDYLPNENYWYYPSDLSMPVFVDQKYVD
jgi:hypothetical protein